MRKKAEKGRVLSIFLTFLKFGCFTFGGGWSIVSQIQKEYVEDTHWITDEELLDFTSVGRSVPGLMISNASVLFGYHAAGFGGALAALAGILWTGRFAGGRYSLGEPSGTDVIAATVLGGASMAGGKASIVGAVFGSVLIGMLNNALVMYGLDTHQQMMVSGLVIILAVAVTVKREPLK